MYLDNNATCGSRRVPISQWNTAIIRKKVKYVEGVGREENKDEFKVDDGTLLDEREQ